MTKEKLLSMMTAKPMPVELFRDRINGRLYRAHYMGMGEWVAIYSPELEELVDDLLRKGNIVETEQLVRFEETQLVRSANEVRMVPTPSYRTGYAIKVNPCLK